MTQSKPSSLSQANQQLSFLSDGRLTIAVSEQGNHFSTVVTWIGSDNSKAEHTYVTEKHPAISLIRGSSMASLQATNSPDTASVQTSLLASQLKGSLLTEPKSPSPSPASTGVSSNTRRRNSRSGTKASASGSPKPSSSRAKRIG